MINVQPLQRIVFNNNNVNLNVLSDELFLNLFEDFVKGYSSESLNTVKPVTHRKWQSDHLIQVPQNKGVSKSK